MKKILIISLTLLISVGVGLTGTKIFFTKQEEQQQLQQQVFESGAEYLLPTMNTFLDTLDEQFFLENSSSELAARFPDRALSVAFSALGALGPFQQVVTIQTDTEKPMASSTSTSSVFLIVESKFERNVAILYVELTQENGSWKINNFNVHPRLLIVINTNPLIDYSWA